MIFQKYIQYVYLGIALLFLIDAIRQYQNGETFWISLLFVGMAIALFFIKRKMAKRFGPKQ
ncbi:hypothetical protein B0A58_13035 [Flavobacterium branchiophilum NBRC 15030 = ATCC 35035]|uniref:LPXTG-motif cell wall-anchored protein n=2 Tax=Flavobacterium branchiophilum TaxID=55197 RepID=G2Z3Z0_FLABF|nr:hypothetical protein [Flavobacterium branchiophilum]OXA72109.1 hypothetical protein B0A58_13035 [Flavobacterium branchiophilum NBRC 15030 = ATCC 35035]TQM40652.1 hypothetical protein BC670_1554 [Flavobacterium branchiophilum]GEM54267.1 hypothetical protein FB1_04880 [Flavobacterium branchiophilum NBRC 15030 = ATCC 35035]CCB68321.1 Hypothetical protein FBFL15_0170 [Flavobacterium branchiophilum FL-15]